MRLYVLSDRRTQAMVQYAQLRKALSDKLGTDRQLAKPHPCWRYATLSLGCTGSGKLIMTLQRINQQYP
jgi:hypothetical protein